MIARMCKMIPAIALLALLASLPTQAVAHPGHSVSSKLQVDLSLLEKSSVQTENEVSSDHIKDAAVRQPQIVQIVFEHIASNDLVPVDACNSLDCGCASCHSPATIPTDFAAPTLSVRSMELPWPVEAALSRSPSSAEQPPKSFA